MKLEVHVVPQTAEVTRETEQNVELEPSRSLAAGRDNLIRVIGLRAEGARPGPRLLQAEGTVALPELPAKPEDAWLQLTVASVAAVGQKPVFDLTGKIRPAGVIQIGTSPWRLTPTAEFDVGLGTSKSPNAFTLTSPFSTATFLCPIRHRQSGELAGYASWRRAPITDLSNVVVSIGPRAEFDRRFGRANLLGSLGFDLNFHRLIGSIADQRALIASDLHATLGTKRGDARAKLVEIPFGAVVVPYVRVDFGGHVNEEEVENKLKMARLTVPRNGVFRVYTGLRGTFEFFAGQLPVTLSVDESIITLGATETIGYVTNDGVALRRPHGLNHRGVATLDIGFDPTKHFSLVLRYENGRAAPNFEYLNKVSAGVKVQC